MAPDVLESAPEKTGCGRKEDENEARGARNFE
jgi:hypothetical protein